MSKPQLGGDGWRTLFTPVRTGVGVNDHCVVRAADRRWHVFGITSPDGAVNPQAERWFCHGTGPSLAAGEFRERGRVCDFGRRAWAPTMAFDGEQWVMLYGPDILRAAISDDPRLDHWQEVPCSVTGAPVGSVMRDGMILKLDDDTWLLYSTGKRGHEGAISVCVSENLLDWRFVRFALRTTPDAPKQPPWGATESPFVFRRGDDYWLSITYTASTEGPAGYHETLLFKSQNPFDFGTYSGDEREVAARLEAHAPEYLVDPKTGRWYVTSAGWPGEAFGTAIEGSVAIRELDWVE
jgi:arabinan endo-1,5-alpha-L-arabinosidase